MASIKGFQLKNIKTPLGREGYGCLATMYLNGKRIGVYEDYGDGSFGNETFDTKEAKEAVMKIAVAYVNEHPSHEFTAHRYRFPWGENSVSFTPEEVQEFKTAISENKAGTVRSDLPFIINDFDETEIG